MRFRRKLLLATITPSFFALTVLFLLHVYSTFREVREVAVSEGTHFTESVCTYIADFMYYGDYDRVARWLRSIPARNIEDILVVSPEGTLIASKREGLVLFKKYEDFDKLRGISGVKVEEDLLKGLFVFAGPVKLNDQILGYVVSYQSFEDLKILVKEHSLSFALTVAILMMLSYMVAYLVSSRVSNHIKVALSYLKAVSEGRFDLPPSPRTGDEFEDLFEGIRSMAGRLKEIHVSRDFYQNLINSLAEGIMVVDGEGRILEANLAVCRIIGCPEEEIKGRHVSELDPELHDHIVFLLKEAGEGRRVARRIRIRTRKGEDLYIFASVSVYDELYILLLSDITKIAKYEEKLRELAEKDHLTKVYNRRMFESFLKHEMEKASRYGRPLSLIMFDIDHFKRINDTYGHQVGDEVLRRLADLVRRNLRKTDIFARWGGEEFMILLPEADISSASKLAERLRRTVESADFGRVGRITVSFGVTEMRRGDSLDAIISRVDRAVYEAKRKGRNRVEVVT